MKTRIRPYAEFLIKQNLAYIVLMIGLIISTVGISVFLNHQVSWINAQIETLRPDVDQLRNKRAAIRSVIGESSENLDQDLQLMSALIPDSEDYFSIITALESLSQQTGFRIDSYTINLQASTSTRLSLTVNGVGDNQSFLNFLQNYHINGGRLITAENIGIDPKATGSSLRLDLNFYNRKATGDIATGSAPIATAAQDLAQIKSKIRFSFVQAPEEAQIQDYPTKANPF